MAVIDYQQFMNDRIQKVKPSGIRRFFDIANEMDHVISLSIGEPDFFHALARPPGGNRITGKGKNLVYPKPGICRASSGNLQLFSTAFSCFL